MRRAKAAGLALVGIGIRLASANFDEFVSAYAYELDLFNHEGQQQQDQPHVPQLKHINSEDLDTVRDDVKHDWQVIVDQTVARYATALQKLTSGSEASSNDDKPQNQALEASQWLLRLFIDWSDRDRDAEKERCAME